MKVAVIGGIGLAVGLAAGTGIGMRSGGTAAVGDSMAVHPDSAMSHSDSAQVAAADSVSTPVHAGVDTSHADAPVPLPSAPMAPADSTLSGRQLASILGKLTGAEAAPLLSRFSDDELLAALKLLGVSRSSDFVSHLPSARGARISRRLLIDLGAGGHQ